MGLKKLVPQVLINYCEHLPLAVIANFKFGFPGQQLRVIGVTGTDGKTTTTNMIYQILKAAGKKVSIVSTINAEIGGVVYDTGFHVTSPDPFKLQGFMKKALRSGDEFMVLEVTSHALDQYRVWGINFEVGVITNITHEHLDYHKSLSRYLRAKAKLIKGVKVAVLNIDDPAFGELAKVALGKVITFGQSREADFNPVNFPLKLKIIGFYNLYNALAAAAVCTNLKIDREIVVNSLEQFSSLEGRMEEIKIDQDAPKKGFKIYIDFAHTPNALKQALQSLKAKTSGRLIAVFGAAAERDERKRPMMGEVAAQVADIIILTSEDPRFEDENKIINEIAKGAYGQLGRINKKNLLRVPDRAKAIRLAIKLARPGDTIGIFGKGHEKSMNIKGVEYLWSDKEQAILALNHAR